MNSLGISTFGRCVTFLSITWAFLSASPEVGAATLSYKFEGYVYQLNLGGDTPPPVPELFDGRFLVGEQITGFFSYDPSADPNSGVPPNTLLKFIIGGTEFTGDTSSTYGGFLAELGGLTYYSWEFAVPVSIRRHVPITANPLLPAPYSVEYPPNIIFSFRASNNHEDPHFLPEQLLASDKWKGQLVFTWGEGEIYGYITSVSRVPEPSTYTVSGLILLSMLCFNLKRCRAPGRDPQSRH